MDEAAEKRISERARRAIQKMDQLRSLIFGALAAHAEGYVEEISVRAPKMSWSLSDPYGAEVEIRHIGGGSLRREAYVTCIFIDATLLDRMSADAAALAISMQIQTALDSHRAKLEAAFAETRKENAAYYAAKGHGHSPT